MLGSHLPLTGLPVADFSARQAPLSRRESYDLRGGDHLPEDRATLYSLQIARWALGTGA